MAGTALSAPMASATPANSLILSGKYIKVGLNEIGGTLGYDNRTSPGILYDGTGTGTFNPSYDYLTPGTAYEGFSIKGSASSAFSFHNNNSQLGAVGIAGGELTSYSGVAYDGATYDQRAVWSATATNGGTSLFVITNDYYFNNDGQQLNIVTTIEALTDLTGLTFGRFTDPDAQAAAGDSSETNNYRGSGSVAASDLVYAEALASKYVIGLYSNASVTHNSGVSDPWSSDPAFYLSGVNAGDGDNAIGLGFNLGDLLSGNKLTFKYQYIFGTDIAAAIGAAGGGGGSTPVPVPDIGTGGTFTPEDVAAGKVNPVFDGGTLSLGSSTSVGSDFTIRAAGGTIDTSGHDLTISGGISGEGGLIKTGDGVLTLTGTNSQNGLDIQGGTVAVNSNDALGSGPITLSGGAVLRSDADLLISQNLQIAAGQQGVIDTGGNSVELTGDASGGGLVVMNTGRMILSGGKLVFETVTIDPNGTVVVNQAADISGTGSFRLGSNASFVAGGNLSFNSEVVILGSNATFNTGAFDVAMNGAISGADCFTKIGTGTLSLNAAGANDIGACVREGRLAFNNVFSGQVWVDQGGTMSGSGRVNGNVEVDGTLSPGNSPGVLVVAGRVTQAAGSTLALDIDGPTAGIGAGHHDQLILTGAGGVYTAGGTIAPILRGITGSATNAYTPQIGDAFQVVSAEGGVAGSFAAISQPSAGLAADTRFDVLYLPKAVVLAVTPTSYAALAAKGGKENAQAAAGAADRNRATPGQRSAGLASALVGLRQGQLLNTLQQAAGEIHADAMDGVLQGARTTRGQLAARLDDAPAAQHRLWGVAGGDSWEIEADEIADGYKSQASSLMFGLDGLLGDGLLIGGAASYGEVDVKAGAMGSSRSTSFQAHGYAAWTTGPYYAHGVVSAGRDTYRTDRSLDLASGQRAYQGKADGASYAADLELGRNLTVGPAELALAAGLSADRTKRDELTETGVSETALTFGDATRDAAQGRVGARLGMQSDLGGVTWRPQASLFVTQELGDEAASLDARLSGLDLTVSAASPGRTAVQLGTQLDAAVSDRARFSLGYRYGWSNEAQGHAVQASASISW